MGTEALELTIGRGRWGVGLSPGLWSEDKGRESGSASWTLWHLNIIHDLSGMIPLL